MSVSAIRITYFQADKLFQLSDLCAVGESQSSPYRITTYKGPEIGLVGSMPAVLNKLHEVNSAIAANEADQPQAADGLLQRLKRACRQR
ncbi:MAG TPA: hypothetical protein VFG52_12235 [Xanthomonadales bacterium]|nr:hypothetical protein [Xanthomonadales bacterium]